MLSHNQNERVLLLRSREGAKYCDEYVDLFVCLYAQNRKAEFHQFLCLLPVAVVRSSFGGVAISYVLSVLCMASCFHIRRNGPMARHLYS